MAGKDINSGTFSTPEQISICCPGTSLTQEKQRKTRLKLKSRCQAGRSSRHFGAFAFGAENEV